MFSGLLRHQTLTWHTYIHVHWIKTDIFKILKSYNENVKQNYSEVSSYSSKNDRDHGNNLQQMLEVGVGEGNHHSLLVGLQTGTATVETSVECSQNSLKKKKNYCMMQLFPKDSMFYSKYIWAAAFIATLPTTARKRRQPDSPWADKWIIKVWHKYTMEFSCKENMKP